FMAVKLPKGNHRVVFTYKNPLYSKLLFLASFLILLGWGMGLALFKRIGLRPKQESFARESRHG
ncbi:MAG: hypothetical protein AAGJ35_12720, partial [Myxococcota bacterium]